MQFFHTTTEVKAAFNSSGSHWFDPDAIRFFNSRIDRRVYGGRFFVSSEQREDDSPRSYHVRLIGWSPEQGYSVSAIGDFMGGMSAKQAKDVAAAAARLLGEHEKRGSEFPSVLEYGQAEAFAKAVSTNLPVSDDDDGWTWTVEHGFERRPYLVAVTAPDGSKAKRDSYHAKRPLPDEVDMTDLRSGVYTVAVSAEGHPVTDWTYEVRA